MTVDGGPAHPSPLGYGAPGRQRGPYGLVQLHSSPDDAQPGLLLALGTLLELVFPTFHERILELSNVSLLYPLTAAGRRRIVSHIILHYCKVIVGGQGMREKEERYGHDYSTVRAR